MHRLAGYKRQWAVGKRLCANIKCSCCSQYCWRSHRRATLLHPAEQLCAIEKVVREEESENSWVKKLQKIVQRGLLPPRLQLESCRKPLGFVWAVGAFGWGLIFARIWVILLYTCTHVHTFASDVELESLCSCDPKMHSWLALLHLTSRCAECIIVETHKDTLVNTHERQQQLRVLNL